ncbi:MAG: hypothetical protein IID05_10710, partial [Gemmatimonadetes bacterium]|nr:hypothetical protein [Gemmatimonadota bacterium]
YAFGYHLFTFAPITLIGLYSLSSTRLHLRDLDAQRAGGTEHEKQR